MKINLDFDGYLNGRPKYDYIFTEHRFQLGEKFDFINDKGDTYFGVVSDIELHLDVQRNEEDLYITIKLDE